MRSVHPFNDNWLYTPADAPASAPDSQFEPVTLPHTNIVLPYHNFDNLEYQFVSTYRKRFTLPEPLNGRRLYVDFDGAMIAATVSINGHTFDEHDGGYVPFSFDLTDYLRDGENVLQVRLDSTERPDIPPYGYVVDYLTFGGVYRDVKLRYVEPVHIADVFVRTKDVLTDNSSVECDVLVRNLDSRPRRVFPSPVLRDLGDQALPFNTAIVTIPPNEEHLFRTTLTAERLRASAQGVSPVELWSPDNPIRYVVDVLLLDYERHIDTPSETGQRWQLDPSQMLDQQEVSFGFREAVFKDDGFYLNGERVKLIGLDRHQTYPYIGAAAPERLQRRDADILKYELGCNIVRTSHYPQSPHFLERCDEIGLLVFEEIPGWQFIGDADWKALSLRDVESMITRDRNHPSIVLWGVRINESWDDEAFYKATNRLAHDLDPTRQTGGVRFFQESQFLEDVFTYNDFSNTIVEPLHTPHLVTEFSGHMFSTKTFDQEERQIEHAVRHARIQDKQLGMGNVTGAIGWCAFDYNTHREFGSGDRICYHGVMDIFRLPKFAAYFYETQADNPPVVRIASFWTPGDRSGGGNDPLTIFSNCDEIEVFVGDDSFGRFQPDRANFPNLSHPPFVVAGMTLGSLSGRNYRELRVVGYRNGQPAAEQRIEADGVPKRLLLMPDDTRLVADGADITRLVFKVTDRYGNRLPHAHSIVTFEIDGPGELIGDNPFALVGGQAALYVKATHQPGVITIRASAARLPSA
ncbi:MAG: hypothetical protein IT319_17455 [Anaerolineae bacterium]|nr:hypothetical protein [Anaerolineae bacterium]